MARSSGWRGSRSATAVAAGARATAIAAAVHNFVSAQFERFFGLANDRLVAIAKSTGQRRNHFRSRAAAAAVLAELITDFVRSLSTDAFIAIVQRVDERGHDFWIADAIKLITEAMDRPTTIFSLAARL